MSLWSARFSKDLDLIGKEYNSSIKVDQVMYKEDIRGSMAHARMLGQCGIISSEDEKEIIGGLESILADIKDGSYKIDQEAEDIHMAIEEELTKRIGTAGKRLHTARSRNDQVAVDMRLYLKKKNLELKEAILDLIESLVGLAKDNTETLMPGYTHLQPAQPVTLAHHLLAYAQMLKRDIHRLEGAIDRMDECPLGACALATTSYPIDRHMTAGDLGFKGPMANSMDAVSDRDFIVDTIYVATMVMTHLSRLSEEIIIFSTLEFGFIRLDDSFSTGSSIMPQKKNPDMAELNRGKAGVVLGKLTAMVTALKGLPLSYNKDMQEDKALAFESLDISLKSLKVMKGMIDTLEVNKDKMRKSASLGYLTATDLADYLVGKGLAFRDAYGLVGRIIGDLSSKGLGLEDMDLDYYKGYHEAFDEDLYEAIDLDVSLAKRKAYGGPAPEAVKVQIEELENFINKTR